MSVVPMEQSHSDREHARFSWSSAYRFAGKLGEPGCPGSVNLSATLPEKPGGPAALEGTMAHELLEGCLENDVDPHDHWMAPAYPEEMLDGVAVAYRWVQRKRVEFPKGEFSFETRTYLTDECHGTFDCRIYDPESRQLFIMDFKFGKVPVYAFQHPQSMGYALGELKKMHAPGAPSLILVDSVWLVIIQPRRWDDHPIVDEKQVSWDDLHKWQAQVLTAIEEADAQPPIYRPSTERCRYCPAAAICPSFSAVLPFNNDGTIQTPAVTMEKPKALRGKAAKAAKEAAGGQLPKLPPVLLVGGQQVNPEHVPEYALKRLAEALTGLPAIKAYVKAVEETANVLALEMDVVLPGFKVVETDPRIAWTASEEDIYQFLRRYDPRSGIHRADVLYESVISITDAKALLKKDIDRLGFKDDAAKDIWQRFAMLTARASKGTRELAPISDPRVSVEQKGADVFKDVVITQ